MFTEHFFNLAKKSELPQRFEAANFSVQPSIIEYYH